MRYIPDTGKQFVLQVPEDKNSYINVKNYDARGLSTIFTGNVVSGAEDGISIGSISDGIGGTLQQYFDVLSVGIELQAHIYRGTSGGGGENPLISVSNAVLQGVDFSTSTVSSNALQTLKYYIFGYDTSTGKMPNAVQIVGQSGQYSKVLDPNKWNQDQYVDINFTRTGQYVVPIIYRVWGSRVEFLGMIGSAKIGFPGASALKFRDYGLKEIPSWNNDPDYWTPEFLNGVISILGGVPTQVKKIIGKEHLKIRPRIEGSQPNYIQCEAVPDGPLVNPEDYQFGDEAKFIIDDTLPIRNAINLAAQGNIKEIFFPAGTYNIRNTSFVNSSSVNYSNITLRGVGEGSRFKRLQASISGSTNPGLFNFTGEGEPIKIEGIRFRSIVFDGNKSSTASLAGPISGSVDPSRYVSETLVFLKYADSISFTECKFIDAGGPGVHAEASSAIIMTNNIFSRLGRSYEPEIRPIEVYETSNSIIQGNIFEFCTSGPYFFSVDFSTINNNIIRSCGDQGVVLETSYQWNAANNLAYSDTDSLIRSVDQYNNEYSKAVIEIRRGTALEPIYFTVTHGGESVGIKTNSIIADIYELDSIGRKDVSKKKGSFRVIQTKDQLEAGIFSVTLPGLQEALVGGLTIPATKDFDLLSPSTGKYGYMYEISGIVKLGSSGRGYTPVNIKSVNVNGPKLAISLKNSSELLSFIVFSAESQDNDYILIDGFSNTNLSAWSKDTAYRVVGIDNDTNSLLIESITGISTTASGIDFLGGQLYIQRSGYQIADGNIFVN